jgi:hypothetical protein
MLTNLKFGAVLAVSIAFASCEKETIVPAGNVPVEITTYVSTHFPDATILQVLNDQEGTRKTYDVRLSDYISLEFDCQKRIIDIDGVEGLPASVIPEAIAQYVRDNYPNEVITDWELDGRNQQIELKNGLDLEFNKDGAFLRIYN